MPFAQRPHRQRLRRFEVQRLAHELAPGLRDLHPQDGATEGSRFIGAENEAAPLQCREGRAGSLILIAGLLNAPQEGGTRTLRRNMLDVCGQCNVSKKNFLAYPLDKLIIYVYN